MGQHSSKKEPIVLEQVKSAKPGQNANIETSAESPSQIPKMGVTNAAKESDDSLNGDVPVAVLHSQRRGSRRPSIASLLPRVNSFLHPKQRRSRHRNLSATFNLADADFKVNLLDINTATEEELMTLPGISRQLASNIVEHRAALGGFKILEDLVVVSGMGASVFQRIRPEICIGSRKGSSRSPSLCNTEGSFSSLAEDTPSTYPTRTLVRDLNTASVFDLMLIPGLTQELAANIVDYRDRKGPFRVIHELRKVKGVNANVFSGIREFVTVSSQEKDRLQSVPASTKLHRRNNSVPAASISDQVSNYARLLDLLSKPESEQQYEPSKLDLENGNAFEAVQNGKRVVRLATWQLDLLTLPKISNPGVREVLGTIIYHHGFSLLALQSVTEEEALIQLCLELNDPKSEKVREAASRSCTTGTWQYCYSGQLAFLYQSQLWTLTQSYERRELHEAKLTEMLIGIFKVGEEECTIVNINPKPQETWSVAKTVSEVLDKVLSVSSTERIMLVGDYSHLPYMEFLEELQSLGYRPLIHPINSTTVQRNAASQDNVLVSRYAQKALTGKWGVIVNGLTHLLIPQDWHWGGPASSHCPVWWELYEEFIG